MTIIVSRTRRRVPLLEVYGRLTYGHLDTSLQEWVRRFLDQGFVQVFVDLAGVDRIDSAGIGELIRCHHRVSTARGRLVFLNPPRKVARLFQRAGLDLIAGLGLDSSGEGPVKAIDQEPLVRSLETMTSAAGMSGAEGSGSAARSRGRVRPRAFALLLCGLGMGGVGEPSKGLLQAGAAVVPPTRNTYASSPRKPGSRRHEKERLRHLVHLYAARHGLPPGLGKQGPLPPGLRRQLAEGGRLPPGLQKRLHPLPPLLIERLDPAPPGHGWFFLGSDLILLDSKREVVVRLFADVLP